MNRETREHRNPKPVKRIELSEKFPKWRLLVAILFAALGIGALVSAATSFFKVDSGWCTVETASAAETNCGSDFVFRYNLGASGMSASEEYKQVQALYTDAMVKAYELFHDTEEFDGVNNICYINQHPNEEITVDEVLYHAFSQVNDQQNRLLYFGPVYEQYVNLFGCRDDSETMNFDPYQNEDIASYFSEIAVFANDPEKIDIKLLGNNQIKLYVSDDYLSYADEIGFSNFINFYFMKNAVIVDYVADLMEEQGHTFGSISSFDGFSHNLDQSGTSYTYSVFDRVGQTVYTAASMQYQNAESMVFLYNYKLSNKDKEYRYEFKNGEIRMPYIDSVDGRCKNATNNLLAYSQEAGCFDILLKILPIYAKDTFEVEQLDTLKQNGIYSVYGKDYVLYYNDPALVLSDFYQKDDICYTSVLKE